MYNQWLLFFYSPLQEIQNKPVKKEWLPDGNMKVSGTHPSAWSVTLQPGTNRPYYLYMYQLHEDKQSSLHQMREAIETRNKEEFSRADQHYESLKENETKGKAWLEKQEKRVNTVEDKLFSAKQELYQLRLQKRNKDYLKTLRTLEEKIRNLTNEKRAVLHEQEELLQNYSTDNPSVRQSGPVPDPPKLSEKRFKKGKDVKDQPPPKEEVQEGGEENGHKIRVIKLDEENS